MVSAYINVRKRTYSYIICKYITIKNTSLDLIRINDINALYIVNMLKKYRNKIYLKSIFDEYYNRKQIIY